MKATEDDRGRGMTAVAGIGGSWQFSNNPRDTQFLGITLYTLVYDQTYIKARTHATALWILRTVVFHDRWVHNIPDEGCVFPVEFMALTHIGRNHRNCSHMARTPSSPGVYIYCGGSQFAPLACV